jgi:carboxylesterase
MYPTTLRFTEQDLPPGSLHLAAGEHAALIVHGLASTPLELRFVGRLLHRAGLSVIAPTLSGYSMDQPCGSWQSWLAQLEAVLDKLVSRYRSVCVAGLSLGATLALALAARRGDVRSLALWSVTLEYDGWLMPWYRALLSPCYALGVGRNYVYRERTPYGLKNEKWRARVASAMEKRQSSAAGPAAIPAGFLLQAARLGKHAAAALGEVSCDTIVIHAADDETASPRNAETVYRRIASLHKRKIMLGDSYHMITMDNERELVARETIRFYRQSLLRAA